MTEPGYPGSNPVWMATTAVLDGDSYVINGRKWFTSSADGARFAIAMVVTDPQADPHARASQIIVPCDTPGFKIVRNISVMGHSGEDWPSHSEISYENVRVPRKNLLGREGAGFEIAQARLGPGRIHHCMRWMGICERSFDLLCERAARRDLAPGDKLGTRQTIQNWIAESRAEINAARLMVLQGGLDDRPGRDQGGSRRDFADQVLCRRRADEGHRPGLASARGVGHDGRHDPFLLLPARTGGADLRRARRSPQECGRAPHPARLRLVVGASNR